MKNFSIRPVLFRCLFSFTARLGPKLHCATCANWVLTTAQSTKDQCTTMVIAVVQGQWKERINLWVPSQTRQQQQHPKRTLHRTPVAVSLWWFQRGSFFENRNKRTKFSKPNSSRFHNFKSPDHFKSLSEPGKAQLLDLLGCITRAQLSHNLSILQHPHLLAILGELHSFTGVVAIHVETQLEVDFLATSDGKKHGKGEYTHADGASTSELLESLPSM